MPLVTITCLEPVAIDHQRAIGDGVHRALVTAGFPASDRFQRLLTLPAARFLVDPRHPDLTRPRTARFTLIEILLSAGRSRDWKGILMQDIVSELRRAPGLEPHDVMVVLTETARDNWSFAGGLQTYVLDGTAGPVSPDYP